MNMLGLIVSSSIIFFFVYCRAVCFFFFTYSELVFLVVFFSAIIHSLLTLRVLPNEEYVILHDQFHPHIRPTINAPVPHIIKQTPCVCMLIILLLPSCTEVHSQNRRLSARVIYLNPYHLCVRLAWARPNVYQDFYKNAYFSPVGFCCFLL